MSNFPHERYCSRGHSSRNFYHVEDRRTGSRVLVMPGIREVTFLIGRGGAGGWPFDACFEDDPGKTAAHCIRLLLNRRKHVNHTRWK